MIQNDEQKKASVSAKVAPGRLRQIYDILEDEQIPFEASVKNVGKGIREITIVADASDIDHFQNVLAYDTIEA